MMAYIMQPMETVCECGCKCGCVCVCLFDLQLHKAFERKLFFLVGGNFPPPTTRILLNGRCECKRRENTTAAGIWQCQTAVHCIACLLFQQRTVVAVAFLWEILGGYSCSKQLNAKGKQFGGALCAVAGNTNTNQFRCKHRCFFILGSSLSRSLALFGRITLMVGTVNWGDID